VRLFQFIILSTCFITQCFGQFTDLKNSIGFQHSHVHPALMGGGVVVFDMNNDGWEDIFLTGGLSRDMLLINEGNFQFEDATRSLPYIPLILETSGAMAGDFNNDGWTDLFITTYDPEIPNVLLYNDEGEGFIEAFQAGIKEPGPSIGGTLIDYNSDGYLDIYVNNYIDTLRFDRDSVGTIIGYDHVAFPNFLYRNNQDGTFTEVSQELNVGGSGCALASLGFIHEGSPVIYVANDYGAWVKSNEYFEYDSVLDEFVEKAEELELDATVYGMGIALGDIGNDLDLDVYVTNIGRNVFYESREQEFHDETDRYGIHNTKAWGELNATSWGTNFFDVENDGDLDLFVANGFIPSANFLPTSPIDSNKLYTWRNGVFTDNTDFYKLGYPGISRGVITSDLDLDGDLDLLVATIGPEDSTDPDLYFKIYENETRTDNNFVQFELKGTGSNPDAFGAEIYLYPEDSNPQMNIVYSGGTHCSQNSKVVHFGLGQSNSIDSVIVVWPNGMRQKHSEGLLVNQKHYIEEGASSTEVLGCTNSNAKNYNALASINSGCLVVSSVLDISDDLQYIRFYPNPVVDHFNIELNENMRNKQLTKVEMFDPNGRLISKHAFYANEVLHTITLPSHIPSGNYVVKVQNTEWQYIYTKQFQLISR